MAKKLCSKLGKLVSTGPKIRNNAIEHGGSHGLNPILKVFLEGVYDDNCELSQLKGLWHVLKKIWNYLTSYWTDNILVTTKGETVEPGDTLSYLNLSVPLDYRRHPFISVFESALRFPKPSGLNVNMMPFIMAKKFADCRLPKYLKSYWLSLINECPLDENEIGRIGYLTIQESDVKKSSSQRRPGLHTERPGRLKIGGEASGMTGKDSFEEGQGISKIIKDQIYHHWGIGLGVSDENCFAIEGGIFMASNIDNSCQIWDCQITDDNLIGHLGDIEHLREFLPTSEVMKANHLYWMTDRTPHESLPLEKSAFRQYFRLVTSQVSIWFEQHSTKNPLGVVPDPNITKIVRGSKFSENGLSFAETPDIGDQKNVEDGTY